MHMLIARWVRTSGTPEASDIGNSPFLHRMRFEYPLWAISTIGNRAQIRWKNRLRSMFIAAVLVGTVVAGSFTAPFSVQAAKKDTTSFEDLNQSQIVEAMGPGWNLGNQLESVTDNVPEETNWGNPVITEKLIQSVKAAGFKSIRIPVSYFAKIDDDKDYTIDSKWLDRVQEVVDYCIKNDLYAVINIHGDGYNTIDGSWLLCNGKNQTEIKKKYKKVWKQIAERFKNYDEHLLFESMNEEFDGSYSEPNKEYYQNINDYNQIFVDTVRKTGDNNTKRWLIIPGWNTNIDYTAGDYGFKLPTDQYRDKSIDKEEQRIMISVHYYSPWDFCGGENGVITQWGNEADDRNDGFTRPSVPSNAEVTSAFWGVWRPWWREYWVWHSGDEDDDGYWCDHGWWEFDLDRYSASLSATMRITPDNKNPTAGSRSMKSGYGVNQLVTADVSSTQSSATTPAQNAVSYFSEFNYEMFWRLLERMDGGYNTRFEFQKNEYSTYRGRTHFTPIWYPNGSYTVNTWLIDCWTPAGMLSMNLSDSLTIRGSLWDDWHIAPLEP